MKSTAANEPIEVAMAAVLPCFWIYKKIGNLIFHNRNKTNNIYQKWIDTYSSEEFEAIVQQAIKLCDKAASNTTEQIRDKMIVAFTTSSKLEYDFWNAAYNFKNPVMMFYF